MMIFEDDRTDTDPYKVWAEWSPKPKKKPLNLSNLASAIVIATAAVHLMNVPVA